MIIQVENTSKSFISNKKTLNSITLDINHNSINVIYGKSGSGKTTLLNILAGLDINFDGNVKILGQNIKNTSDEERAKLRLTKIGLIYQFFNLLPDLTIKENILLPSIILGTPDHLKCNELIKYFNIEHIQNQAPAQCSGGELQRASFARALINSPELIIADEPTGNLDSKNTENVIQLIQKLNSKFNTTFIIATHDDAFKSITSSIFELKDGSLVF